MMTMSDVVKNSDEREKKAGQPPVMHELNGRLVTISDTAKDYNTYSQFFNVKIKDGKTLQEIVDEMLPIEATRKFLKIAMLAFPADNKRSKPPIM